MQTPPSTLPTQANQHFLNALINMSSEQDIEVSEDIFAQNGMKLLARGTRVCPKLYGQVVSHKLLKPIETSLTASNLPDINASMVEEGERLLDELPFLRRVCGATSSENAPLRTLATMPFRSQAATLVAVASSRQEGVRRHHVLVALLAMGLANAHRYRDTQLLTGLGLAGIFHDVGELYVDPAIIDSTTQLTPKQWLSYSAHPIIGAALAREIAGFDPLVQRAILEHHERQDGFGYPRSLQGATVSVAGRLLALAETLSALITQRAAVRRIDIALKINPGEYDPEIVALIHDMIGECGEERQEAPEEVGTDVMNSVHGILARIANVVSVHDEVAQQAARFSAPAQTALSDCFQRFIRVERCFSSTGIAGLAVLGEQLNPQELQESRFEAVCVLDELAWRLVKLSRELSLKCMQLPEAESAVLMRMAEALAGEASAGSERE